MWRLLPYSHGFFRLQQASSGRFLDAYLSETQDFQAVTRPANQGESQLWRIADVPSPRIVNVQGVGLRFLDAHEYAERDFNVVTRDPQLNDTQRWVLTQGQGSLYRIQQAQAADSSTQINPESRLPCRHPPRQENTTQLWRLYDYGGAFFKVQQASSGRFLEGLISEAQDFQVVTRPESGTNFKYRDRGRLMSSTLRP